MSLIAKFYSSQSLPIFRLLSVLHPHLVYMPPVLVIVQALPQHSHNFVARHHVVGQVRDVRHLRAGWPPGVIRGRLSHLENTSEVPAALKLETSFNEPQWKLLQHCLNEYTTLSVGYK